MYAEPAKSYNKVEPPSTDGSGVKAEIVLFVLISAWAPLVDYGYPAYLETTRYAVYLLFALFLLWRMGMRMPVRGGAPAIVFLLYSAYALLSSLWTDDVLFSAIKSAVFVLSVLACYSVSGRISSERIVASCVAALAIFVAAGILAVYFLPSVGVENSWQHAGKWRGLAGQKNVFGLCGAVLLICVWAPNQYLPELLARHRLVKVIINVVGLTAVIMSQSRGAVADLLVGGTVLLAFRYAGTALRPLFVLSVLLGPALITLVLGSTSIDGTVISIFGVEFDTSNRVLIWRYSFSQMYGHEAFGFGYGGFWSEVRANEFQSIYGWVLPNFHNGYISLIVEAGIVGSAIFTLFLVTLTVRCVHAIDIIRRSGAGVLVALVSMFFIHNVYENNLTRSTNFFLIIFMLSMFSISRLTDRGGIARVVPTKLRPSARLYG